MRFPQYISGREKIKLYMLENFLVVEYTIQISEKLFNDISKGGRDNYIWSYLSEILPYINAQIQKIKYSKGQVLLRTLSFFDISIATVFKNKTLVTAKENNVFSDFSNIFGDNTFYDYIYIRDYMDSVTAILYYEYEEVIKKCITSVENYFIQHGIKKTKFKETLKRVMEPSNEKYGNNIIYENICYIYDVRNEIVHNSLRIDYNKDEWGILCKIAVATLQYLFQRICEDKKERRYIFDVYTKYCMINVVTDTTLSSITEDNKLEQSKVKTSNKPFNEIMLDSLIITKETKMAIDNRL